jgi:GDP-4-dehydro-6-deoxy-D-mannose reductase
MTSRVAVTGVNGFVGRHMVAELRQHGYDVVGIGHEDGPAVEGLADYRCADLTLGWPHGIEADRIIHLAGLSAVGPSFANPQRYLDANSSMVTHLCEALVDQGPRTRVLVVSSGAVYDATWRQPLAEDAPIGFSSPYVVSKVLVENQVAYYARRGLDTVVARPFNHIGPGQGPGFLVPDLLAGAVDAARSGGPLTVGDLETRRDYTDVRDVVRAYRLLLDADSADSPVYNVCSGRSWSGGELLGLLRDVWAFGDLRLQVDESRKRPGDPREVVGDATRLHRATGWKPEIDIAQSVQDYVAAATN